MRGVVLVPRAAAARSVAEPAGVFGGFAHGECFSFGGVVGSSCDRGGRSVIGIEFVGFGGVSEGGKLCSVVAQLYVGP